MTMHFCYYPNRDKGKRFVDTLLDSGEYQITKNVGRADFLLVDYEGRCPHDIDISLKRHIPVFIYPHAAMTFLAWDGMYPVNKNITCNFIPSFGQRQVMWSYGYPCKTLVTGWPYSEVKPFEPYNNKKDKLQILFAPLHNIKESRKRFASSFWDEKFHANRIAFEMLLKIPESQLTVYKVGDPLSDNNIPTHPDVTYLESDLSVAKSVKMISDPKYDLIVSFDTFAWIAVALGKPTIMYTQNQRWQGVLGPAGHWDKYNKKILYPYELMEMDLTENLLLEILQSDSKINGWKNTFIGAPFSEYAFLYNVKTILEEQKEALLI